MTKYLTMTEAPSIEKTMRRNNYSGKQSIWATDLTIAQIYDVLDASKELEREL